MRKRKMKKRKKLPKALFTLLGIAVFVFCIADEIDGVGRFACIVFGTLFSILGSLL